MRRSICVLLLCALAVLASSDEADAVPVDIHYSIQLQIDIPAYGVFPAFSGSGTQTLRFFNGTSGGHASPGPIQILSGGAFLTGSFFVSMTFFSGTQSFINLGTGAGTATAGGNFALTTGNHVIQGFIHCMGANCASFGFQSSVPFPLTSQLQFFSQTGLIAGFPSLGPQSFSAMGTAGTFGGATLVVTVVGQEVDRTVVPEPGTGLLVGLGLAGLGLAGARGRATRRH